MPQKSFIRHLTSLTVSMFPAHSGQGLELLSQAVQQCLMGELQHFDLVLKPAYGKLRTQLYTLNVIQSEHHDDHGDLHLSVCIAPHKLEQLIKQAHLPLDEILGKSFIQAGFGRI